MFVSVLVVMTVGVKALQCYQTGSYDSSFYNVKACGASCEAESDEPKTCEDCLNLITSSYPTIGGVCFIGGRGSILNWNVILGGCTWPAYRDVRCWKYFSKKSHLNNIWIQENYETGKSCDTICDELHYKCIGIGIDANEQNVNGLPADIVHGLNNLYKYQNSEGYWYASNGGCNSIMYASGTGFYSDYSTNCYCLACESGYYDCNNNWNDGCEATTCCKQGQSCSSGKPCCSGLSCSGGICQPQQPYDNCGWDNAHPWKNFTTKQNCSNTFNGKKGCARDMNGDGKFDQVCCVDWSNEINANWITGNQCSKY